MKKELLGLGAASNYINKPITFSKHSIIMNGSIHELKAEIVFHPKEKEIILDRYSRILFFGEWSDEEQLIIGMELTSLNKHVKSKNKGTREELDSLIGEDGCTLTIYYEPYVRQTGVLQNGVRENEMSPLDVLGGLYNIVDCYGWVGDLEDSFDESIPYKGNMVSNYEDTDIEDYFEETIKTLHTMPREKGTKGKLEYEGNIKRKERRDDDY